MSKYDTCTESTPGCCRNLAGMLDARFFKALCDPSRIAILARLLDFKEPVTVSEIAACCPTDLSVVSRHLAMLREAGIVESRKTGKTVYYKVRYREVAKALRTMAAAIEACGPQPNKHRKAGTVHEYKKSNP